MPASASPERYGLALAKRSRRSSKWYVTSRIFLRSRIVGPNSNTLHRTDRIYGILQTILAIHPRHVFSILLGFAAVTTGMRAQAPPATRPVILHAARLLDIEAGRILT